MKRHALLCGLVFVVGLFFAACNDDVFVDDYVPADSLEATIDGDGGEATIEIPMKKLERISVDRYDGMKQFKCYDRDGEEIPADSPASAIAKIVFESIWLNYEICVDGDALRIKSIENCSGSNFLEYIRLEYAYATRFIKVNIKAGKEMCLKNCRYDGGIDIVENAGTRSERESFSNAGHIEQSFDVYPMVQAQSYAYGMITTEDKWVKSFTLRMPVLQYRDGWVLETCKEEISAGEKYRMTIPNLLDKVTVPAPPNTKVVVTAEVTLTTARAGGVMTFRAPVSGKEYDVPFKCEAIFPKGYDLKIEDAEI